MMVMWLRSWLIQESHARFEGSLRKQVISLGFPRTYLTLVTGEILERVDR